MTRRTLPQRRRAETFALTACNQQLIIRLGFYPDNSLGERASAVLPDRVPATALHGPLLLSRILVSVLKSNKGLHSRP